MRIKDVKRVRLEPDTDLRHIVEDVHLDKEPRLIERDGEVLAVVVDPEDFPGTSTEPKSKRCKDALLSFAGAWRDLDADRMINEIYRARDDMPPSPPVDL